MNQEMAEKIGHYKREVSALNKKVEQQNDLIQRLVQQNAELQYEIRKLKEQ